MITKKTYINFILSAVILFAASMFFVTCKSSQTTQLQNDNWNTNYDFVFVHGLSGWGHYDSRNRFFPYWGMKNGSLMEQLQKQGFKVYDASVAPQGSAWDRTCELYAQLTGTVTDYGLEHSARCGHPRFGRDFSKEPLISTWNSQNKINLLGHSFGGVTVRLLAHLMAQGSEAERAVFNEYKAAFNSIADEKVIIGNKSMNLRDAFYLYGLIAHYGKQGRASLMPIFEN